MTSIRDTLIIHCCWCEHRKSPFLSSKIEKKFWGVAQSPPYSPPPSAPTAPLAPRSYGARPRRLRLSPRPPDFPPPFSHTFDAHVRSERAGPQSERSREQKFQGMKWPGSEAPGSDLARERIGQGPTGRFAPGNELAQEWKSSVQLTQSLSTSAASIALLNTLPSNSSSKQSTNETVLIFTISTELNYSKIEKTFVTSRRVYILVNINNVTTKKHNEPLSSSGVT